MGIERFFSSISTNSVTNLTESFNKTHTGELDITELYIDFNSIIHVSSAKVVSELNVIIYRLIINETDDKRFQKLSNKYNINEKIDYKKLVTLFDEQYIDAAIKNDVMNYIYNLLGEYIVSESLKLLYIAIDGVPSKAKIVTQKQRRYMGEVISGLKKSIFKLHEKEIKKDKVRYLFETNKIQWSRNKISPGSRFIDSIHRELHYNGRFNQKIRQICPNLKQYIYSSQYIHGEGEMKIIREMREIKDPKGRFMIYSPDSDVISLCLLLNIDESPKRKHVIKNLVMLRHNQQKNNYDIINIDKLKHNIFTFVKANITNPKLQLDEYNVISDVVFIFTIFGNDFLPRIESYNVSHDFTRIIKKYADLINATSDYMIGFDRKNNQKIINYRVFFEFMKVLQMNEGGNLQNVYLTSHFRNYSRLKKLMKVESDNFIQEMNEFGDSIRDFNTDITKEDKIEKVVGKWNSEEHKKFISILRTLTNFSAKSRNEFIVKYYTYCKRSNKFPKINLELQEYDKSMNNDYHQQKLKDKFRNYKEFSPTKYDEEIYKLDNMLDEYIDKLNHKDLDLGKLYMTGDYMWKSEKIVEGVKRYYAEYFAIKDINISNNKMKKLVEEYLIGFVWVFEYYFNQHIIADNAISEWSYNHLRSPLLSQIYYYLRNIDDKNILIKYRETVYKTYVNTQNYFNNIEHLLYVSPCREMIEVIPEEFRSFVKKDTKYYPDISSVIKNITKTRKNNEIDCRGVSFLNKCHLRTLVTKVPDKTFLNDIRKIKVSKDTEQLSGRSVIDKEKYDIIFHKPMPIGNVK